MALTGYILVTPEQLSAQAQAVNTELGRMQEYFETLKKQMSETSAFWTGEAGDAHRDLYLSKLSAVEEMLRRYQEHVRDLEIMAGVYAQTETLVTNAADALPASALD